MSELTPILKNIDNLKAENARLKTELEYITRLVSALGNVSGTGHTLSVMGDLRAHSKAIRKRRGM